MAILFFQFAQGKNFSIIPNTYLSFTSNFQYISKSFQLFIVNSITRTYNFLPLSHVPLIHAIITSYLGYFINLLIGLPAPTLAHFCVASLVFLSITLREIMVESKSGQVAHLIKTLQGLPASFVTKADILTDLFFVLKGLLKLYIFFFLLKPPKVLTTSLTVSLSTVVIYFVLATLVSWQFLKHGKDGPSLMPLDFLFLCLDALVLDNHMTHSLNLSVL